MGDSIAVVFPSFFREYLRKKGYEVLHMADPVDEYGVQQLKESDGTKLKPTMKEEKIVAATYGDSGDGVGASNGVDVAARGQVDVERVRQHTGAAAWQRQPHSSKQQPTRKKKGQVEKEKGQGERESDERGKREEQGEEKSETGEDGKGVQEETDKEVEEDVTDWVEVRRRTRGESRKRVQIFVKVNGSKATPMEVSLTDDKVEDVVKQAQNDEDAFVRDNARKSVEDKGKAEELRSQ